MAVVSCPCCAETVRLPSVELPEDATVCCPWCNETLPVARWTRALPPLAVVRDADGKPMDFAIESATRHDSNDRIDLDREVDLESELDLLESCSRSEIASPAPIERGRDDDVYPSEITVQQPTLDEIEEAWEQPDGSQPDEAQPDEARSDEAHAQESDGGVQPSDDPWQAEADSETTIESAEDLRTAAGFGRQDDAEPVGQRQSIDQFAHAIAEHSSAQHDSIQHDSIQQDSLQLSDEFESDDRDGDEPHTESESPLLEEQRPRRQWNARQHAGGGLELARTDHDQASFAEDQRSFYQRDYWGRRQSRAIRFLKLASPSLIALPIIGAILYYSGINAGWFSEESTGGGEMYAQLDSMPEVTAAATEPESSPMESIDDSASDDDVDSVFASDRAAEGFAGDQDGSETIQSPRDIDSVIESLREDPPPSNVESSGGKTVLMRAQEQLAKQAQANVSPVEIPKATPGPDQPVLRFPDQTPSIGEIVQASAQADVAEPSGRDRIESKPQPVGTQPSSTQPSNIQPTNIQPSNIQPSNIQPLQLPTLGSDSAGQLRTEAPSQVDQPTTESLAEPPSETAIETPSEPVIDQPDAVVASEQPSARLDMPAEQAGPAEETAFAEPAEQVKPAEPGEQIDPVVSEVRGDGEKNSAPSAPRQPADQAPSVDAPEVVSGVRAALDSVEQLARIDGDSQRAALAGLVAYRDVSRIGDLPVVAESQPVMELLDRIAGDDLVDQLEPLCAAWIDWDRRKTDGMLLIGHIRQAAGERVFELSDGTRLVIQAGPGLTTESRVVALGQLSPEDTPRTIRLHAVVVAE